MAIVYKHIRLDKNEVFYIGIGEFESRAYDKFLRTNYWKNIAKKGYIVEILFKDLTWEQACQKERELIAFYGRKDLGVGSLVNLTDGGQGPKGVIRSKETRNKISESRKGKCMGDNNPSKRLDVREKLHNTLSKLKDNHSSKRSDVKIKIGDSMKKWWKNIDSTKRDSLVGKNHPNAIPVSKYDKQGNFIQHYATITEAKNDIGKSSIGNIKSVCLGLRKSAGGFIWKFKN
jgi:hypothetical protein